MTHTGYDEIVELEIPQKLKAITEYKLRLPDKIEITEFTIDIIKKKEQIIATIKETNNGRKQKSAAGKLF